jgi:uncharacterized membrane protein YozB (DUF420 family)
MFPFDYLPHVNAFLNSASALLLMAGFARIRHKDRIGHRRFMLSALVCSALFLVSYLVYHAHAGSIRFHGRGSVRTLYFGILISHTVLAAVVLPMVLITLRHALKQTFDRHRRIARLTLPVWFYVSVTGVLVYLMLYRMRF